MNKLSDTKLGVGLNFESKNVMKRAENPVNNKKRYGESTRINLYPQLWVGRFERPKLTKLQNCKLVMQP